MMPRNRRAAGYNSNPAPHVRSRLVFSISQRKGIHHTLPALLLVSEPDGIGSGQLPPITPSQRVTRVARRAASLK
jgi:hypothetical protein